MKPIYNLTFLIIKAPYLNDISNEVTTNIFPLSKTANKTIKEFNITPLTPNLFYRTAQKSLNLLSI